MSRRKTRSQEILMNGFENIGNTCYLNSALQCLRHTALFQTFFGKTGDWSSHQHADRKGYKLVTETAKIIQSDPPIKNPRDFVMGFMEVALDFNPDIRLGAQADADEAVHIILDVIHTHISRPVIMEIVGSQGKTLSSDQSELVQSLESWSKYFQKEYSPFVTAFYGQTQTKLICQTPGCTLTSSIYEPWDQLKLEIPGAEIPGAIAPTLQECFTSAFIPEVPSDFICESCKCVGTTRKEHTISRYPQHLIISLKRFINNGSKIRAKITYDADCIDLTELRAWPAIQDVSECEYRVMSTIEHLGTSRGGHYCMRQRQRQKQGQGQGVWFVYDDETVSISSRGGDPGPDTYVLFLERL